jgi:hypothetical protein
MSHTDDKVLRQFQARYRKASKKEPLPSWVNSSRPCVCWSCRSTRTPTEPPVRSVWKAPAKQAPFTATPDAFVLLVAAKKVGHLLPPHLSWPCRPGVVPRTFKDPHPLLSVE